MTSRMPHFTADASIFSGRQYYRARMPNQAPTQVMPVVASLLSQCERCINRCQQSIFGTSWHTELCDIICRAQCGHLPE
jgi:hypothetical protein